MRIFWNSPAPLRRLVFSIAAVSLSAAVLTSCTIVPDDSPEIATSSTPAPSPSVSGEGISPEEEAALAQIYAHIGSSDPQIVDILSVGFTSSEQGQNMIIDVLFSDDDPITTETLVNILLAAEDMAPDDTYQISIAAHPVSEPSSLRSLEDAAAGLPASVNYEWTGWELHVYDVNAGSLNGLR